MMMGTLPLTIDDLLKSTALFASKRACQTAKNLAVCYHLTRDVLHETRDGTCTQQIAADLVAGEQRLAGNT